MLQDIYSKHTLSEKLIYSIKNNPKHIINAKNYLTK